MDVNKILLNVVSMDEKHVHTHPKFIVASHVMFARAFCSHKYVLLM